jgi:hypothetical protein
MTELGFYRTWLAMPLIAPIPALAVGRLGLTPPEPILGIALDLVLSFGLGAVPYALIAAPVWFWLRGRPPAQVRVAALALPLVLAVVTAIVPLLYGLWPHALRIGYVYVGLFLLSEFVARRAGWLRPTPARSPRAWPQAPATRRD